MISASTIGSFCGDCAPAVNSTRLPGKKRVLSNRTQNVALGQLVLASQPEHDLPPEPLMGRAKPLHRPPPGGIAGEGHHATVAKVLADQQGLAFLAVGLGQDGGPGLDPREAVRALQEREFGPGRGILLRRRQA